MPNSEWVDVVTSPRLPVEHGEELYLTCSNGQRNTGAKTATCMDGRLVQPEGDAPPQCPGIDCIICCSRANNLNQYLSRILARMIQLQYKVFIFSDVCSEPLPGKVKTDPILPVHHGTELKLFCAFDTYNINNGGETAVCHDGEIIPDPLRGCPVCICE